jgi:hypothetical protein
MGNIITRFSRSKSIAIKSINNYICTDLIKYIISDYINYNHLECLQQNYKHKKRIITTNTVYFDRNTYSIIYKDYDTNIVREININGTTKVIITHFKNYHKHKTYFNERLKSIHLVSPENNKILGYKRMYTKGYNYTIILDIKEMYIDKTAYSIKYTYHPKSNDIKEIINFKNNLRNGYTYTYNKYGVLIYKIKYKKNLKNGWSEYYGISDNKPYLQILYTKDVEVQRIENIYTDMIL